MAWLIVIAAGILEAGFAIFLKLSHGFRRIEPTVLFAIFALGSFGLLSLGAQAPGGRSRLCGMDWPGRCRHGSGRDDLAE
jgi:Small Multidrug Resistance protein